MNANVKSVTQSLGRMKSALTQSGSAARSLRTAVTATNAPLKNLKTSADRAASSVQRSAKNVAGSGKSYTTFSRGLKTATTAQKGLNTAMKANLLGAIAALVMPLVSKLVDMAMRSKAVQNALKKLGEFGAKAMAALKQKALEVWSVIGPYVKAVVSDMVNKVKAYVNLLLNVWRAVFTAVGTAFTVAVNVVKAGVNGFRAAMSWIGDAVSNARNFVAGGVENIKAFFRDLPGSITGFLSSLPGRLADLGRNMIQSLANGIRSMAGSVLSAIKNSVIDKIPGPIRSALGIHSPSTVMMGLGRNVGEGMALGMEDSSSLVGTAAARLADAAALPSRRNAYRSLTLARTLSAQGGVPSVPGQVVVNVHPRAGHSEYEIGRIAARELAWAGKR